MTRRQIREVIFKMLYEQEIRGEEKPVEKEITPTYGDDLNPTEED